MMPTVLDFMLHIAWCMMTLSEMDLERITWGATVSESDKVSLNTCFVAWACLLGCGLRAEQKWRNCILSRACLKRKTPAVQIPELIQTCTSFSDVFSAWLHAHLCFWLPLVSRFGCFFRRFTTLTAELRSSVPFLSQTLTFPLPARTRNCLRVATFDVENAHPIP